MRSIGLQISHALILTKLYADGFLLVDPESKTVTIDMRRDVLAKRYQDQSVDDILYVLDRTAIGLEMSGYTVEREEGDHELRARNGRIGRPQQE